MDVTTAIIATDEVNLQNIKVPLSGLVQSIETPLSKAIDRGLPHGMPMHIAHDLCRPIGWSKPRGVHIAGDKSRLIATMHHPETDEERAKLHEVRTAYLYARQSEEVVPFADELQARIAGLTPIEFRWWHGEATAAVGPDLAVAIYPEFFVPGGVHVDKDGLVDLDYLLSRTHQIQPGVFHEPEQDLLLFAHRYLRRSLTLMNHLNAYLLDSFAEASGLPEVKARLRLDSGLVGHPASAKPVLEFEYWHGPLYSDDIASIPPGVAEHKNSTGDRLFSRIDKTQIWWKNPETRLSDDGGSRRVRTFEIEELIEDPSPDFDPEVYGCRYAHAEYCLATKVMSHFDGAIRAYGGDAYLERIDSKINRAGKHSSYTKLFRLDGTIPVASWKRVLSDFFRGNCLIPEYLGAHEDDLTRMQPADTNAQRERRVPALSAFLSLEPAHKLPPAATEVGTDQVITLDGESVAIAEIGPGALADQMRRWLLPGSATAAATAPQANLARIHLPGNPPCAADWPAAAQPLADAIRTDAAAGLLATVAVAMSWQAAGVQTTLSIVGEADRVADLLADSCGLVRPEEAASTWVEQFRDALLRHAPALDAEVAFPTDMASIGRMILERPDSMEFVIGSVRPDASKALPDKDK